MYADGKDPADDKCIMQLFSTGTTDNCNWYRMWEAMTAVFSICVRGGRGGVFMGLGQFVPLSTVFDALLVRRLW